jgi:syntaxin 1B/2/3
MSSPLLHNPEGPGHISGGHKALSLNDFLNEVTAVRNAIGSFRQNVLQISALHNQTLQSYDNGAMSGSSSELEALVAETSTLSKGLRDAIKSLERDALIMDDYASQNTKRQQAEKLKMDFERELREYQKVRLCR